MKTGKIASIIGGLGLIIGALLPWTTYDWPTDWINNEFVTRVRHYGYEVLGLYTGVIGIIIIIMVIFSMLNNSKNIYSVIVVILSIVSAVILILTKLGQKISEEFGIGYIISYIATITTLIGGIIMKKRGDEESKLIVQ